MSWYEYNDMFPQAQKRGNYKLFVFDLKNSRQAGNFIPVVRKFLNSIYRELQELEQKQGKKILHISPLFNHYDRGDLTEPFLFMGDLFGFTVLRDSISDEEVYDIIKKKKQEMNIPYSFYYASGFYETDDYGEGYRKYFRGYAMAYLEHQAKQSGKTL